MTLFNQDNPSRGWDLEQSRERATRREMAADEWPTLPVLAPIAARPVALTAPEFTRKRFGLCPECPELDVIDLSRHVCPARD